MDTVFELDLDMLAAAAPAPVPVAADSIAGRKRRRSAAAAAAVTTCPMCNKVLPVSEAAANEHVDKCLTKALGPTDSTSSSAAGGDSEPARKRKGKTSAGGTGSGAGKRASRPEAPPPDVLREHGLTSALNPVQQVALMLGTVGVPGSALLGHSVMAPASDQGEEAVPSHGTLPWLGYEAVAPLPGDTRVSSGGECVVIVAVAHADREMPPLLTEDAVTVDAICSKLLTQAADVHLACLLHVRYLPSPVAAAHAHGAASAEHSAQEDGGELLASGDAMIVAGINGDPIVLADLPQELTLHSWGTGGLLRALSNVADNANTTPSAAAASQQAPLRLLATVQVAQYAPLWKRLLSNWGRDLQCDCSASLSSVPAAASAGSSSSNSMLRRRTTHSGAALHPLHAHCGRRLSGDVALYTWFTLDTLLHELGPRAFPALRKAAFTDASTTPPASDDLSPLSLALLSSWQQHAAYRHLIATVPRYAQYFDLTAPRVGGISRSGSVAMARPSTSPLTEGDVTLAVGKWITAAVMAWLAPE